MKCPKCKSNMDGPLTKGFPFEKRPIYECGNCGRVWVLSSGKLILYQS